MYACDVTGHLPQLPPPVHLVCAGQGARLRASPRIKVFARWPVKASSARWRCPARGQPRRSAPTAQRDPRCCGRAS
eukprot:3720394-Prymnesium_polylepis.1